MQKKRPSTRKETQHEKFVKLARESGADESESVFVDKLRVMASPNPKKKPKKKGET